MFQAFVIAFTSDFIPKTYYYFTNYTMVDYVDDSLSYFDASNLSIAYPSFPNVTVCRYRDYRKPPCRLKLDGIRRTHGDCDDSYSLQDRWWIILSLRLIFVLVFEVLRIMGLNVYYGYFSAVLHLILYIDEHLVRETFIHIKYFCSLSEKVSREVNFELLCIII